MAIIRELFKNTIKGAQALGIDKDYQVRHVGYGAEVSGANTMVSDEDDYQKEIIAKFGDLYFDSSENPEETTSGMAM